MEDQDEQARGIARRLMPHHLPSREVRVGTGTDDAAVHVELPLQDDDPVRSCVQVRPALETGRVPGEVVFFAAAGLLVEQPQADWLVVGGSSCWGGFFQLD